jgi:hypothetical protein
VKGAVRAEVKLVRFWYGSMESEGASGDLGHREAPEKATRGHSGILFVLA